MKGTYAKCTSITHSSSRMVKAKKDAVSCKSWWTAINASGKLIIPEGDLQVIMKHQASESWMSCQPHLEGLIAAGHAGTAIGGKPYRTLQQSKLEVIIDHLIQEVKGKDITNCMEGTVINTFQDECKEADLDSQLMHDQRILN